MEHKRLNELIQKKHEMLKNNEGDVAMMSIDQQIIRELVLGGSLYMGVSKKRLLDESKRQEPLAPYTIVNQVTGQALWLTFTDKRYAKEAMEQKDTLRDDLAVIDVDIAQLVHMMEVGRKDVGGIAINPFTDCSDFLVDDMVFSAVADCIADIYRARYILHR